MVIGHARDQGYVRLLVIEDDYLPIFVVFGNIAIERIHHVSSNLVSLALLFATVLVGLFVSGKRRVKYYKTRVSTPVGQGVA